jgi:hypothetical protein
MAVGWKKPPDFVGLAEDERIPSPGVRFRRAVAIIDFRATFSIRDMEQNPPPPFPSPEELKAKITEFMKSNFGDRVSVATLTQPEPAAESEEPPPKTSGEEFVFNFLPRDIKAHLDRFVIKQDEAKKVL